MENETLVSLSLFEKFKYLTSKLRLILNI